MILSLSEIIETFEYSFYDKKLTNWGNMAISKVLFVVTFEKVKLNHVDT